MLARKDERRRVRDPVPRRRRRVPFRDGQFRRPRAAGHDLPRALRRDLAARSADLGTGRRRRRDPPSDHRRPIATCGRGRTCWSSSRRGSSFRRSPRADGTRKFKRLQGLHRQLREGARRRLPGRLARQGRRQGHCAASPIRSSGNATSRTSRFFTYPWPENMRYYRYANKDYLEFAEKHALFGTPPVQVIMQMYSEPLQKFRLAGQGLYDGPQPNSLDRLRAAGEVLRSAAVLVRAAGNAAHCRAASIRSTRSRSGR